jgi:RHS repeat-associated protein
LNRRYQRTATTITSGENRNPANADFGGWHGRGRFNDFTAQVCLDLANAQRNRADIGTFTAPDPLVDVRNPNSLNPYAYAEHNPITLSDPTGLAPAGCWDWLCDSVGGWVNGAIEGMTEPFREFAANFAGGATGLGCPSGTPGCAQYTSDRAYQAAKQATEIPRIPIGNPDSTTYKVAHVVGEITGIPLPGAAAASGSRLAVGASTLATRLSWRGVLGAAIRPVQRVVSSFSKPEGGWVNVFSRENVKHIIDGDSPTSGGHLWPANPGKSAFPWHWSKEKVSHAVSDIVTDPATKWTNQTGPQGSLYTNTGDPAKWRAEETRWGKLIRVFYIPATGDVPTGFPPF